jgi:hypothetical protein
MKADCDGYVEEKNKESEIFQTSEAYVKRKKVKK